jgi:hypothetical protein
MSLALLALSFPSARAADYTGDGIDDLVVGVPFEQDIGGIAQPGGVEVIRGSAAGLVSTGDAFIHQNTPGVAGMDEPNEHFGKALGAGDVDGDGIDDLIIGAPDELIGSDHSGMVWRLDMTATATALTVVRSELVSQSAGETDSGDRFGEAITAADFDGDGYDDVVVGIPGQDIGSAFDAGAIRYVRGSSTGLTTAGAQYYHQDRPGVADSAESGDAFGSTLAAGDFDADGYADLAVGVPLEDWSGAAEGAVHLMYGSASGPGVASPNDELWTAGEASAAGELQDANNCGRALAVGDFDADGYDDLAIGCPGYDVPGLTQVGAVLLVYGSAAGLDTSELWTEDTPGVDGDPDQLGQLGAALTAGDYDGDGYDDLAMAAPGHEGTTGVEGAGIVHVLLGASTGLSDVDDLVLSQDPLNVVFGTPTMYEYWGFSMTSGDYDGDGRDELVVGSEFDMDVADYAGSVNVFPGSARGPSTNGDQWWHQDRPGIADSAEVLDQFGYSLR